MNLEQALDFLASNCTSVFAPISEEITRLNTENIALSEKVDLTQNALNDLIFSTLNGGN